MVKRPLHNRYERPKGKAPGTQRRDSTRQYGEERVPRNAVFWPRNRLCSGLVNRIWRIAATGFCFVVFGIGGIVMALMVPILLLIPHIKYRETLARAIIHHWFKAYVWLMKVLGVLIIEVRGAQKLQRQGLLILANHPSLIDVVILISLVKNSVCIVKEALWANPFTWAPVYLAGFIRNTGGPKLIDEAIRSIHAGNNLILFPEGTRTCPDRPIFFKRGAANIVLRGNIQRVTPVMIKCSEPTLTKGNAWYQIPRQTLHFQLEVLDDLVFSTDLGQIPTGLTQNRPGCVTLAGRVCACKRRPFRRLAACCSKPLLNPPCRTICVLSSSARLARTILHKPHPINDDYELAIQVRNLTQYLQHYFSERIQKHGSSQ